VRYPFDYRLPSIARLASWAIAAATLAMATPATAQGCNSGSNPNSALLSSASCQANGSGDGAVAVGSNAAATGTFSTAVGSLSEATKFGGVALGKETIAGGLHSTALGFQADANGLGATSVGFRAGLNSVASGATSLGYNSIASGVYATALGGGDGIDRNPRAVGDYSIASVAATT
jgi:hypothetical protein